MKSTLSITASYRDRTVPQRSFPISDWECHCLRISDSQRVAEESGYRKLGGAFCQLRFSKQSFADKCVPNLEIGNEHSAMRRWISRLLPAILTILLLLLTPQPAAAVPRINGGAAAKLEVASPTGVVKASVWADDTGRLTYSVQQAGTVAIEPSPMGITIDGVDIGNGVRLEQPRRGELNETFPLRGAHAVATNHYCSAEIPVVRGTSGSRFVLEVRAFDDGVGWRYRIPGDGARKVQGEASSWTLPSGSRVWFGERNNDWKLKSYAGEWMSAGIDEMPTVSKQGPVQGAPLVVELPQGGYAAVSESAVFNYSGMRLRAIGQRRFQADFTEGKTGFELNGEILTPWRVVILAKDLNGLINQTVIANLAPPPDPKLFTDTAWIRPGSCVWRWQLQGAGTPRDQRGFADDAARLGYPYLLVDEGWEVDWKAPFPDLKNLCDYAAKRKVGVFVWKRWAELRDPGDHYALLRVWLDQVSTAGCVGVKVDFFNSEDLATRLGEEAVLRETAKRRLLVDIHGCPKPVGESRTYPNELSREGVRGLELNFMSEGPLPPRHDAALPFTRYIVGPGDYTPVTFQPGHMGATTMAHQLATAVVLTSPLFVLNEIPSNVLNHPVREIPEFLKSLPTVWDETRVLPGSKIGGLAVLARRHGNCWFVAAVDGDSALEYHLDLNFLSDGKWDAALIADGSDSPLAVKGWHEPVTSATTLSFKLLSGGGFVAKFVFTGN